MKKWIALLLTVCLLGVSCAFAEETDAQAEWLPFLLICNEGMQNDGGNVGNTLMVVAVAPYTGQIRLATITWDTFVNYAGYDIPQLLDQPYRNNGPEATMQVFNDNFNLDINRFLSLNYLNLADLIDTFGGVTVDITRAERNALNGMVASKKSTLQAAPDAGLMSQVVVEMLAKEYYLNDYGPETHLNGLQSVAFGWLQYDSVYNCCQREIKVISNLFHSVGNAVAENVVFYTDASGVPEEVGSRRAINLDQVSDDDMSFLRTMVNPIFDKSYNNLTDEEISSIALALVHSAYQASRQGKNIFDAIELGVFPLEAMQPYDRIANVEGHIVDFEANSDALKTFLFGDREIAY